MEGVFAPRFTPPFSSSLGPSCTSCLGTEAASLLSSIPSSFLHIVCLGSRAQNCRIVPDKDEREIWELLPLQSSPISHCCILRRPLAPPLPKVQVGGEARGWACLLNRGDLVAGGDETGKSWARSQVEMLFCSPRAPALLLLVFTILGGRILLEADQHGPQQKRSMGCVPHCVAQMADGSCSESLSGRLRK